jgi:hypothetical protein
MRIAIHAFSIEGLGHLQRARAIADALVGHEIVWLSHHPAGAPGAPIAAPLVFDSDPPSQGQLMALAQNGLALASRLHDEAYDLLVTEHFPFGGRYFDAAYHPLLHAACDCGIPVVASVRDIITRIGKILVGPRRRWPQRTNVFPPSSGTATPAFWASTSRLPPSCAHRSCQRAMSLWAPNVHGSRSRVIGSPVAAVVAAVAWPSA